METVDCKYEIQNLKLVNDSSDSQLFRFRLSS